MNLPCIVVIDSDFCFRLGLTNLLELEFSDHDIIGFESIDAYSDYHSTHTLRVDLIVYGGLFHNVKEIGVVAELQNQNKSAHILVMASHAFDFLMIQLISLNITGFINKNIAEEELKDAISSTLRGQTFFNKKALNLIHQNFLSSSIGDDLMQKKQMLNNLEIDILRFTCLGLTAAEIAAKVSLSPRTVEGYRRKLLQKTQTKSIAHLSLYAICNHIIDINDYSLI